VQKKSETKLTQANGARKNQASADWARAGRRDATCLKSKIYQNC